MQRSKELKVSTRRLIQKTLLEKYFETNNLSVDETKEFLKHFSD